MKRRDLLKIGAGLTIAALPVFSSGLEVKTANSVEYIEYLQRSLENAEKKNMIVFQPPNETRSVFRLVEIVNTNYHNLPDAYYDEKYDNENPKLIDPKNAIGRFYINDYDMFEKCNEWIKTAQNMANSSSVCYITREYFDITERFYNIGKSNILPPGKKNLILAVTTKDSGILGAY